MHVYNSLDDNVDVVAMDVANNAKLQECVSVYEVSVPIAHSVKMI